MRLQPVLATALVVAAGLAGCAGDPTSDDGAGAGTVGPCPEEGLPEAHQDLASEDALRAYWNTSMGDIVVELYHERAPVTVANHVGYAVRGFYDGTIFHRVIPGFVIQGGGLDANLTKLETRPPIPLERHPALENERGTLSMARGNNPNSATSQFFVNVADNTESLGRGAGYAVFGEVVRGMDVVDAIVNVSTHEEDGRSNVPVDDVVLRCVSLSLPSDETDPGARASPVHDAVHPAPDAETQVAFQVVNDWDAAREIQVEPAGDATDVEVPLADANGTLALHPGGSALAIATVPAGTNGTAAVEVTEGGGTSDRAETRVRPTEGSGPAIDRTNNTRVHVRFTGLLQTGIPFGTNEEDIDERQGLRILPGHGRPAEPLKLWTGDGEDPEGNYTKAPQALRDPLLGLQTGHTTLASVESGSADAPSRWFHLRVVDVRSQ